MPSAFDRCVAKVAAAKAARNPYAVCRAAMKGRKRARTRRKKAGK